MDGKDESDEKHFGKKRGEMGVGGDQRSEGSCSPAGGKFKG